MAKEILCGFGVDVDAVAGWLGSYGGEDSPDDISRGLFAGEVGAPRLLELFRRWGIRTSWFIPGHSIETFPAEMKAVYDAAWSAVLRRVNSAADTSSPSSLAQPSRAGLPSGTSNATTENPPSGVGSAATGTPSTFQKMGSLPKTEIGATELPPETMRSISEQTVSEGEAPAVRAVRAMLATSDLQVPTGAIDADGNMITRSAREVMAEADQQIAEAQRSASGIEAAVNCLLTEGADAA